MYKTACFLAALLYAAAPTSAQNKISLSVYAGAGVSWYGGKDVAKTATYYPTTTWATPAYVDRRYGNKMENNWIGGVRADYWFRGSSWNLALSAQVESTGGEGTITKEVSSAGTRDVKGEYRISNDYVSINPQVGNVVKIGKTALLFRAGLDYAIHATRREYYMVPDPNDDIPHITSYSAGPGRDDIRLTANMLIPLGKKWEFDISYKHGLIKFADHDAYLRMLHCKVGFAIIRPKMGRGVPKF
jgi:hypothetical protein